MATMNSQTEIFIVQPLSTVAIEPSVQKTDNEENSIRALNASKRQNAPQNRNQVPVQFVPRMDDSKIIDAFYGLLVLLIITASPFSLIILPMNNLFTEPRYWYELPISTISVTVFTSASFVR